MLNKPPSSLLASLLVLGPWTPFAVALLDSAFVPLAQSVDVLIAVCAATSPGSAYLAAFWGTAGSTLGSLILYAISRRGGRALLERRLPPQKIERIRKQMERYGSLALALPTMIPAPLPMRPMVVAAGAFRMGVVRFAAVIAGARAVRYFGIAFVAVRYGEPAVEYLNEYGLAVFGVSVALFIAAILWRRLRRESLPAPLAAPELPEARGNIA